SRLRSTFPARVGEGFAFWRIFPSASERPSSRFQPRADPPADLLGLRHAGLPRDGPALLEQVQVDHEHEASASLHRNVLFSPRAAAVWVGRRGERVGRGRSEGRGGGRWAPAPDASSYILTLAGPPESNAALPVAFEVLLK